MPTIEYTETLVTTNCWCGIHLAVPDNMLRHAQEKGTEIYCPLGHSFVFKSENARLTRELEDERRRRKASQDLLHAEERSHAATRGHLTRTRKRVAAGVCPCCQRTFQQLARHMKTKHPDYREST